MSFSLSIRRAEAVVIYEMTLRWIAPENLILARVIQVARNPKFAMRCPQKSDRVRLVYFAK